MPVHKVSVTACGRYDAELLDWAVRRHFELLGIKKLLRPGMKVVVKPNLIIGKPPEAAVTTHPKVVAAVVRALKSHGVEDITLAESSGGIYSAGYMNRIFRVTGMAEMAKATGIKLNDDFGYKELVFEKAKRCGRFQIINPAVTADLTVNIAKLKTHAMMGFSGAAKNIFGFVPGLLKPELHCRFPAQREFAEMLVDLAEGINPEINFIDGIIGMEGDGPTGGKPRQVGALLAGESCFAVDIAAMKLIGFPLSDSPLHMEAVRRGHITGDFSDIELAGDPPSGIIVGDYKKSRAGSVDFVSRLPRFMRGAA
ncbi:MAG TPA: iron-sulfur protein, partial [Ruminococcaceae bacterium]|nr:iron-sulfur protein [Oscillospiraceae bacterium]